jgi:hypothetical protein
MKVFISRRNAFQNTEQQYRLLLLDASTHLRFEDKISPYTPVTHEEILWVNSPLDLQELWIILTPKDSLPVWLIPKNDQFTYTQQ